MTKLMKFAGVVAALLAAAGINAAVAKERPTKEIVEKVHKDIIEKTRVDKQPTTEKVIQDQVKDKNLPPAK